VQAQVQAQAQWREEVIPLARPIPSSCTELFDYLSNRIRSISMRKSTESEHRIGPVTSAKTSKSALHRAAVMPASTYKKYVQAVSLYTGEDQERAVSSRPSRSHSISSLTHSLARQALYQSNHFSLGTRRANRYHDDISLRRHRADAFEIRHEREAHQLAAGLEEALRRERQRRHHLRGARKNWNKLQNLSLNFRRTACLRQTLA
jgi:hypothetical protein